MIGVRNNWGFQVTAGSKTFFQSMIIYIDNLSPKCPISLSGHSSLHSSFCSSMVSFLFAFGLHFTGTSQVLATDSLKWRGSRRQPLSHRASSAIFNIFHLAFQVTFQNMSSFIQPLLNYTFLLLLGKVWPLYNSVDWRELTQENEKLKITHLLIYDPSEGV